MSARGGSWPSAAVRIHPRETPLQEHVNNMRRLNRRHGSKSTHNLQEDEARVSEKGRKWREAKERREAGAARRSGGRQGQQKEGKEQNEKEERAEEGKGGKGRPRQKFTASTALLASVFCKGASFITTCESAQSIYVQTAGSQPCKYGKRSMGVTTLGPMHAEHVRRGLQGINAVQLLPPSPIAVARVRPPKASPALSAARSA